MAVRSPITDTERRYPDTGIGGRTAATLLAHIHAITPARARYILRALLDRGVLRTNARLRLVVPIS